MPLTDRKPDAACVNYARALLESASAAGGAPRVEEIQGELEDILELARQDRAFGEFLASRVIGAARRDAALKRIFEGRVSPVTLRFLSILNQRGRLGDLPAIASAYDSIAQSSFGRVEVDVFTAEPLDAATLRTVADRLSGVLARQVVAHPYVDGSMIGGVKFRIGDQLIDASVSTRLRKMREKIARDGSAALKARFDRAIDESSN